MAQIITMTIISTKRFIQTLTVLFTLTYLCNGQDLSRICELYNNSLTIVQPFMHNSLTIWNVCLDTDGDDHSHSIESIESKIISFDYNYRHNYFLYLRQDYQLHKVPLLRTTVPNGTATFYDEKLATFSDLKPEKIVLDWIHELLYMIVDDSQIFVTNLNRIQEQPILLLERQQASIKKVLLCTKLSLLIWQEIEWTGTNHNRIWIAQQDGTESMAIYFSAHYIQDIQIDQSSMILYFTTNSDLGMITLNDIHHQKSIQNNFVPQNFVHRFSIRSDIKHFAIMNPYIFTIQFGELVIQDLRNDKNVQKKYFKNRRLNSIVQSQFVLFHRHSQSRIDPICFDKESCEDLCVPNGNFARYTCFCYREPDSCSDYGHHSFDTFKNILESLPSLPVRNESEKNIISESYQITESYVVAEKVFQFDHSKPVNESIKRQVERHVIQEVTVPSNISELNEISDDSVHNSTKNLSQTVLNANNQEFVNNHEFPEKFIKYIFEYIDYNKKSSQNLDAWIHENRSLLFVCAVFGSFILGFLATALLVIICSLVNRYRHSYTISISPKTRKSIPLKRNVSTIAMNKIDSKPVFMSIEDYNESQTKKLAECKPFGNLYVQEQCSNNNNNKALIDSECDRSIFFSNKHNIENDKHNGHSQHRHLLHQSTFYNPLFKYSSHIHMPQATSAVLALKDTTESTSETIMDTVLTAKPTSTSTDLYY